MCSLSKGLYVLTPVDERNCFGARCFHCFPGTPDVSDSENLNANIAAGLLSQKALPISDVGSVRIAVSDIRTPLPLQKRTFEQRIQT